MTWFNMLKREGQAAKVWPVLCCLAWLQPASDGTPAGITAHRNKQIGLPRLATTAMAPSYARPRLGSPPKVTNRPGQSSEPAEVPKWGSCAGHLCGVWAGKRANFSPHTGKPEAFALDSAGRKAFDAATLSTADLDDNGCLMESVHWRMEGDEKAGYEQCEEDTIASSEPGLAYFEVGEYSRGPRELILPQGQGALPGTATSATFTSSLHDGAQRRARTRINVALERDEQSGGLTLELLSLAVWVETWVGPLATRMAERAAESHSLSMEPLSRQEPLNPRALEGMWHVFERAAHPGEDHNGEATLYWLSQHLEQEWSQHEKEGSNDSAEWAIWLPEGLWASLEQMDDGGLRLRTGWMLREGVQQVLTREYSSGGALEEVRSSCCVRNGWAGGIM